MFIDYTNQRTLNRTNVFLISKNKHSHEVNKYQISVIYHVVFPMNSALTPSNYIILISEVQVPRS